ncbi:hypothetical protein OF83DRAFT_1169811 [Amylostereum chailletii]|nr:hypothetical protein OF83DRAFT_1169811 [Amylostereum chailletii]
MPSVFFLGATGYIGGCVLVALRRRHPDWPVTALVRKVQHVGCIRALGVAVVPGSFSDESLIIEQTGQADYVVNIADSKSVSLTVAILVGMKLRHVDGRGKGTLFHTSGLATLLDGRREGVFDPGGRVFDDADQDAIRSVMPSMPHSDVEIPILKASEAGYIDSYILCPGAILGPSKGPVNVPNPFLKLVVPLFLSLKHGACVGQGTNEVPLVYVDDVVDYFLRVIELAYSVWDAGSGPYQRFFVVSASVYSWRNISRAVAGAMHRRGLLEDDSLVSVPPHGEVSRQLQHFSENALIVAEKGKALGWGPLRVDTREWFDEILDDFLTSSH